MGVETEDYKTKQAHVELVRKIKKREPHRDFDEGERVSFILAKGTGETSALAYEKAESTETAIKSRMLPDYKHYIEHQVRQLVHLVQKIFLDFKTINTDSSTVSTSVGYKCHFHNT